MTVPTAQNSGCPTDAAHTPSERSGGPIFKPGPDEKILLFDGECALCNGWVDFVIRRDPTARVKFVSLQSDLGRRVLAGVGLDWNEPAPEPPSSEVAKPTGSLDSMIFITAGRPHLRSRAFLELVGELRFPWPALAVGAVLPRPIRDWLYDQIAAHRYEWFGRREVCRVPTPEVAKHFLEDR